MKPNGNDLAEGNPFDEMEIARRYVTGEFGDTETNAAVDAWRTGVIRKMLFPDVEGVANRSYNTILDVGCATANLANNLKNWQKDIEYTGCDASLIMLQTARTNGIKRPLIQVKLPRLPFKDNSFDIATCFATLCLMVVCDQRQSILELNRIAGTACFFDIIVKKGSTDKTRYMAGNGRTVSTEIIGSEDIPYLLDGISTVAIMTGQMPDARIAGFPDVDYPLSHLFWQIDSGA